MCKHCENLGEMDEIFIKKEPFLPGNQALVSIGINENKKLEFYAGMECGGDLVSVFCDINFCPICGKEL